MVTVTAACEACGNEFSYEKLRRERPRVKCDACSVAAELANLAEALTRVPAVAAIAVTALECVKAFGNFKPGDIMQLPEGVEAFDTEYFRAVYE